MADTDLIIVGAGPSGLFAAFYAGMRNLTVRLVDPQEEPGGQLTALYPEKYIFDVGGFPKVRAAELVENLVQQIEIFSPVYTLGARAEELKKVDNGFSITTQNGEAYGGKAVVITAGVGAIEPRKLGVPGEDEFFARGVGYSVRKMEAYRGRRVLIVGGGDSAVDWALMLKDLAQVTLIHRRTKFRAHAASANQLIAAQEAREIEVLTPYQIREIRGNSEVREVALFHSDTNAERVMPVDDVLILAGSLAKLGPLENWGLDLEKGRIKVNTKMETSMPGVFAAGDVTTYPGKLKLIALGFGEAAIAANHAAAFAYPELKADPGHSSEKPPEGTEAQPEMVQISMPES